MLPGSSFPPVWTMPWLEVAGAPEGLSGLVELEHAVANVVTRPSVAAAAGLRAPDMRRIFTRERRPQVLAGSEFFETTGRGASKHLGTRMRL